MRPKKKALDRRGVLLKEQPFTFRARKDGTVAIFWNQRPATVLEGKLAENFLAAAPEHTAHELQLLMAKATGNFKRGNEKRR
ncbi:MAG: hypothetical protein H0U00_03970 [Actinobacteria bacterium]|nr:hypothetical protein [Actinomycetota bacterium]